MGEGAGVAGPVVDVLGEPYVAETLQLAPDSEGEVVATLVSRRSSAEGPSRRAVLHLHGFCDYFFQTAAADFWVERGYDFYALDLRKYGRSLRPHQTPNFVTDLRDYFAEVDEAFARIRDRDGHTHVVVTAHSTGGLIAPLWADSRRPALAGMVLNSPWLDLHGSFLLRTAGTAAIDQVGARRPYLTIPRNVSGLYAQSLHQDHRGVDVGAPVLLLTSGASSFPREWHDDVSRHDIVLDVEQIRKWGHKLADHVTMTRIEGALHDVTLSAEPVRTRVFDEITGWLDAYVTPTP